MSIKSRIRAWLNMEDLSVIGAPESKFVISRQGKPLKDFVHGVEILNDNVTSMKFVVGTLMKHFDMKEGSAIAAMGAGHIKGSVVLPTDTREQAEQIAQAITADAREQNFPLVCRAIRAGQAIPENVS
jgi:ATP-dependent Clp protease adapter protein ClpS